MFDRHDASYQLNLSNGDIDDNNIIQSLLFSYMLSLGEFKYDEFGSAQYSSFLWLFFLLSTMILQITILNMIIAIMGDTFDQVMEK